MNITVVFCVGLKQLLCYFQEPHDILQPTVILQPNIGCTTLGRPKVLFFKIINKH